MPSPAGVARATVASRPTKRARTARLWFRVHSWLGLKLSVLLAIVLASGTLAVWSEEIDWLLFPAMRVAPGPERVGLEAIRAAILDAHPDVLFQVGFSTGADRTHVAVGAIGVAPELGVRIFWVDQYRGVFTGSTPYFSPGYFLGELHRKLMLPLGGEALVTALTFVLAASLVTGLVVYKRFWRGFLRRPRTRDMRTLLGDLHRLLAVWSLWFVLIMVLTGLWYFWTLVAVPDLGAPAPPDRPRAPALSSAQVPTSAAAARRIGLDAAARAAQAHRPGFTVMYVDPPLTNGEVYAVHGHSGELLAPYQSAIFVDPFTGAVLSESHAGDAPLMARLGYAVTPLHFGTWAGPGGASVLASKAIWFVFGAALSFIAFSGVLIYWRRLAPATRPGPWRRAARALTPWGGTLGLLKLPSLLIVAAAAAGTLATWHFMAVPGSLPLAPRQVGTLELAPSLNAGPGGGRPLAPGARPYVLVPRLMELDRAFRRVMVAAVPQGAEADLASWSELAGSGRVGAARLAALPAGPMRLMLRATTWDGEVFTAEWPLGMPAGQGSAGSPG